MLRKEARVKIPQESFLDPLLVDICNPDNRYVRLANIIDWNKAIAYIVPCFQEGHKPGRPSLDPRLVVSILMLQAMNKLSDEEVLETWSENAAWQYFSGRIHFVMERPFDSSSLTHWRKRLGPEVLKRLLAMTVQTALDTKALTKKDLETVVVDTTAQRQNIKRPGAAGLMADAYGVLQAYAKRFDIPLRRNLQKNMLQNEADYADLINRKKTKEANVLLEESRAMLSEIIADIARSPFANLPDVARDLENARKVQTQARWSTNKLYSFYQPHTAAIVKNGTCVFGSKASLVTSARNPFILAIHVYTDNRYDGHTLDDALHLTAQTTGVVPKVAACDLGYRGAEITLPTKVHCFNRKRPAPDELIPLKRRRPSIEPIIGHLKSDHCLGLNRLSGEQGCTINALFAAIGFNLRKPQRHLARFLLFIFTHLPTSFSRNFSFSSSHPLSSYA